MSTVPIGVYHDDDKVPAIKRVKTNALLLMDSNPDVTLSNFSTKFNPDVHLAFLLNKRIHREIKKKQAALQAPLEGEPPQLWMYLDSGLPDL